jgi:RIO-like serine/threonine protein kinase
MAVANTNDMNLDIFEKTNVGYDEYLIAVLLQRTTQLPIPEIYGYNSDTKTMRVKKMDHLSLADFYGINDVEFPKEIYECVRKIVQTLDNLGIDYPDITPYNFIEDDNGEIWIVDFEHASMRNQDEPRNEFMEKFLDGHDGWNPVYMP